MTYKPVRAGFKQIRCTTCGPGRPSVGCADCRGSGYVEVRDNCPHTNVSYDPMCHGWECHDCGGSGPWKGRAPGRWGFRS